MSITEKLTDAATEPAPHHQGPQRRRRPGRRVLALAGAAGALVAAGSGVGLWAALHRPPLPPGAPIVLPQQLHGLGRAPAGEDPTRVTRWQERARAAVPAGVMLAAQGYATADRSRTVRAVAARTDLTGKLELGWAADAGHQVGDDRCTQNIRPVPAARAGVRPTVILCWRTSATLSAYVLVLAPKHVLTDADGTAPLDQLWAAAGHR